MSTKTGSKGIIQKTICTFWSFFFWTMAYGKVREKGVKNRMASVLTPPRALGTFTTGAYPRLNWLKRMDDDDGWLQAPPG